MAATGYGFGDSSDDLFSPPSPYDSRRRLPFVRPVDGAASPNQASEPTVNSPSDQNQPQVQAPVAGEDPRDPYRQAITQAQQKESSAEGELAGMNYVPKPRSLGSRIGEGIVGSIFPALAENIWERPRQQEQFAFQQNLAQKGRQVTALHNATNESLRNLQLQQSGELQHQRAEQSAAYTDYLRQRPMPQVHQPKLDELHADYVNEDIQKGADPGADPRVQQLEHAITSTQRQSNDNDVEFFQHDPKGYQQYQRVHHMFDPAQTRPTADESRINLYRKDPKAFKEIYGDKDKSDQDISDALSGRLFGIASKGATDQLTGEVDQDKAIALYDKLVQRELARRGKPGTGGAIDTSPAPATMNQARGSGSGAQYSGKQLDPKTAAGYLQKAGGDKDRARQLAKQDGWNF